MTDSTHNRAMKHRRQRLLHLYGKSPDAIGRVVHRFSPFSNLSETVQRLGQCRLVMKVVLSLAPLSLE